MMAPGLSDAADRFPRSPRSLERNTTPEMLAAGVARLAVTVPFGVAVHAALVFGFRLRAVRELIKLVREQMARRRR